MDHGWRMLIIRNKGEISVNGTPEKFHGLVINSGRIFGPFPICGMLRTTNDKERDSKETTRKGQGAKEISVIWKKRTSRTVIARIGQFH